MIFIDEGSAGFDVDKITIVTLRPVRFHDGKRIENVWVYEDDPDKQQRRVLQFDHITTLTGRAPRTVTPGVKLTTIYGYDPVNRRWGPQERTAYLDCTWKNTARLLREARSLAESRQFFLAAGGDYNHYRRG